MKYQHLLYILKHHEEFTEDTFADWEAIVDEYPYFQAARAMYLKGLHLKKSFLYNKELKQIAAQTTNREVLFDFITSKQFSESKKHKVDIIEIQPKVTEKTPQKYQNKVAFIRDDEPVANVATVDKADKTIEEEKISNKQTEEPPVEFESNQKHSFFEWLQLTKVDLIAEEKEEKTEENQQKEKNIQLEIIDRFIETSPKITPVKTVSNVSYVSNNEVFEEQSFMTETLAKIYLDQRKYAKAIQAYEILILKYPEKSSYFAEKISDIKDLQNFQNN